MTPLGLGRRALLVLLVAAAAPAATLIRGPYLQNVRPTAATVVWTTLEPGLGQIDYRADGEEWRNAVAVRRPFPATETGQSFDYYQYSGELTGLVPGSQYRYRASLDDALVVENDGLRFRTPAPGPFRFLVFGDSGTGGVEQLRLAEAINREDPMLVLHTGDVAQYVGAFREYEDYYFKPYGPLMSHAPFYPTPGNHDYLTGNAAPYLAVHSLPAAGVAANDRGRYYSFDWGDVHFVALDSNMPLTDAASGAGQMLQWLESDLRATRCYWRIVYFHHGAYPAGPHIGEVQAGLVRGLVTPILERYGVQVAFNGHEHFHMRTRALEAGVAVPDGAGTVYITTGGGGGVLHTASDQSLAASYSSIHHFLRCDVDGGRLTIQVISQDGVEVERYAIAPLPRLRTGSVVNSASFQPGLAPGGLVSIFGYSLATGEQAAQSLPLPEELASSTVRLGAGRLPLLYASPVQINLQLPYGVSGRQILKVTSPNGSGELEISMPSAAPAIFMVPSPEGAVPAMVHVSGILVSPRSPAAPGEVVSAYLTGLGAVDGSIQAGQPAPIVPLARTLATVESRIATRLLSCTYSGLAPGFAGLYQVNVRIPEDAAPGSYPFRIFADGVPSDPVPLAIGP